VTIEQYEVLSGERRRRRWPRALKEEIVLETLSGVTVTEVARRRDLDRSLIYRWRREMKVSRDERFLPVHLAGGASPVAAAPEERPADSPDADRHPEGFLPTGRMEIALGGDRRVTVFADVDAGALSRVIEALEGRPVRRSTECEGG